MSIIRDAVDQKDRPKDTNLLRKLDTIYRYTHATYARSDCLVQSQGSVSSRTRCVYPYLGGWPTATTYPCFKQVSTSLRSDWLSTSVSIPLVSAQTRLNSANLTSVKRFHGYILNPLQFIGVCSQRAININPYTDYD